ncbi:amidohydrolase 2 [Dendrothele bispora CBS 962.96]|uniref:Amidohydrolase 2 n=1 Tax=Dendrothele bispora (strain CBS 962.96) TaxID=1314807 RepID=A0A4S8N0A1_DENBC|nr:amidohydrolase 2 [Dendrothele bispora CBS 962.96]
MPRIDVHHHSFLAVFLDKAKANESIGWRTPPENLPWTPEISLRSMDESHIDAAILSFPAVSSDEVGQESRDKARKMNIVFKETCEKYPGRFGFFAALPCLNDVEGVLAEIGYALDTLGAQGIAMASSCGIGDNAKYLGDDLYDSIWAELDKRGAVVHLHGAQTPSSTPYPHPLLGLPVSEVPNETYKAASHLVVTGRKRKYPNVKIILAHMGGSTPFLCSRVAVLSNHMGCELSPDEIIQDFKTFYYDTALSAHESTLNMMESFVGHDRLLFGTDFPAVTTEMAAWYTRNLEGFYTDKKEALDSVMYKNALKLFPNLKISQG